MTALPSTSLVDSVIEPLCKATGDLMKPVHFLERDFLFLDIDPEAKRFEAWVEAYAPAEQNLCKHCHKTEEQHQGWEHTFEEQITTVINGRTYRKHAMGPSYEARHQGKWWQRIPERKEITDHRGNKKWLIAGTDFTVLVIHSLWKRDNIVFKTPEAQLLFEYLLKRFMHQNRAARIAANFRVNRVIPELPADAIIHPENPPLPYQQVPIAMFLHQESAALFMEQGTGKTAVAINRINIESTRKFQGRTPGVPKGMYRVLIICPNQVRLNWVKEFERFATVPGKSSVLRGDVLARNRNLIDVVRDEPDCVWSAAIIGIDSLASSLELIKLVNWDLCIVDESHYFKSRRRNRWAAIKELRDAPAPGGPRQRMVLTGTPIANTLNDLWTQLEFLGEGMSGFMGYEGFKNFHGSYIKSGVGNFHEKLVGLLNVPLLQERLARVAFLIKKEEAGLDLPDMLPSVIEIEMTPTQAEYYNKVRDQIKVEIQSEREGGKKLHTSHVLTKLLRLAQITSGFIRWDDTINEQGEIEQDGFVEPIPGGNPKLEAMIEQLQDPMRDPRGKTIIWSCFRASITMIGERLEQEGIKFVEYWGNTSEGDRAKAVHYFNSDPSIKVFLGNPSTAGSGINLLGYDTSDPELFDTYCDMEIVFDQGWSAVQRSQAIARAHRKGTRFPVKVIDLTCPGTIDEEIRDRVTRKIDVANQIQDVTEILKNVLNLD